MLVVLKELDGEKQDGFHSAGLWDSYFQVNQTVLNVVVGTEVACWFFIGECIGKGSLVGYQV